MRFLIGLVTTLALLYGGYWVAGRTAKVAAIDGAITQLRETGWQVETADIATRGFPSRFDTTFEEPRLTAPSGMIAWQAPWAQLLAVSYLPNRAILALADSQTLTVAGEPVAIATRDMRASVRVAPATRLPLEAVTMEAGPTALLGPGWEARFGRLLAAIRDRGTPGDYDLYLDLSQIELPVEAPSLGAALPLVRLEGTLTLDAPLDRHTTAVRPLRLDLRELRMVWGPSTALVTADLTWTDGLPNGPVSLDVTAWKTLLDGLTEAGLLTEAQAQRNADAFRLSAGESDTVTLDFEVRDGILFFGFFPILSIYRQ